jgi:hypothetical protein
MCDTGWLLNWFQVEFAAGLTCAEAVKIVAVLMFACSAVPCNHRQCTVAERTRCAGEIQITKLPYAGQSRHVCSAGAFLSTVVTI